MRSVVEVRVMWIWVVCWFVGDLFLHPVLARWGLFTEISTKDLMHEDLSAAFLVLGLWIFASRRIPIAY